MTVPVPDLLPRVEKPSRYLGLEINSIHKVQDEVILRVALVFPDLYELGMAHLGMHILYGLGNRVDKVQVERVFLPSPDMLSLLRQEGFPLFTLESRTPVSDCGLVGVTLQSELTYTNILTVLDASGIPLVSRDRAENHPIVVGGGPCAFNPEPLWEFFDLFFLGEAEDNWPEMLRILALASENGLDRKGKILALKKIPGVYDPGDFEPQYNDDGEIAGITRAGGSTTLTRPIIQALDGVYPQASFIVPFSPPVHDRVNIETTRGCTRGCRFCHAGMVFRPVRERSADSVLETARVALAVTGHNDLALTSLSIGDYSSLDEVLGSLMDRYEKDRISISLPSMRIGGLTPSIARQILRVRRTGFTIAPEAGTARLRRVINKDFTDEEILQTARWVFGHGWDGLKLYFMIGLPTENEDDLEAIAALVGEIVREAPPRARVTVNLSPFVPKPHTPFQWVPQLPEPELKRRLDFLKKRLRGRNVQMKWGRTDQALLEAVLARGDRRLSAAIRRAWENGAVMDGWDEHFRMDLWREAFRETGFDPERYAERERAQEEPLPWDHIPSGVDREFLLGEYRKSLIAETTPDCREAGCVTCGACTREQKNTLPPMREQALPSGEAGVGVKAWTSEADTVVRRLRFVFSKVGDLRFLGHLETIKAIERACRRAGIPLAFSGGFSPKPRITFALSLPTGAEGLHEFMDLELAETISVKEVVDRVNGNLPRGLSLIRGWKVPPESGALNGRVCHMTYRALLPDSWDGLKQLTECFMERESIPVIRVRKGKERTLDLKDYLLSLTAHDERTIVYTLELKGEKGSARPAEVVQALLDLDDDSLTDVRFVRTSLSLRLDSAPALSRAGMARIWD